TCPRPPAWATPSTAAPTWASKPRRIDGALASAGHAPGGSRARAGGRARARHVRPDRAHLRPRQPPALALGGPVLALAHGAPAAARAARGGAGAGAGH